MYCAIIGDIIHSKSIRDRAAVQNTLRKTLDTINDGFSIGIASNLTITLGDEFQGLLKHPHQLVRIIAFIRACMYPARIRFGIGIGEMATPINREIAIGADGPAYHYAREQITQIKKNGKRYERPEQETGMGSGNLSAAFADDLVNAAFSLCTLIEKRWTDKQREKIAAYLAHGSNQRETARSLGLAQSSVQKGLEASGYHTYRHAMDMIQHTLSAAWRNTHD